MRRVVVTGIGIVCGLGRSRDEVWGALVSGRPAFGDPTLFDRGEASRAPVGEARLPEAPSREGRAGSARGGPGRLDGMVLRAAREALSQAGLAPGTRTAPFGVSLGTSNGGMLEAEEWYADDLAARRQQIGRRSSPLSASRVLSLPGSCSADRLAALLGARGPRLTVTTACSSSAASIALAAERIRDGESAAMVAGGGDPLCRLTYAGFASLRLLDPEGCRPFDEKRRGLTLGEGAAVLVLEDEERAARRGARPLAEILGHGFSCDAWHMTGCHPEGRGMKSALEGALERAGLPSSRIGYVNAHGTATPANDAAEGRALADVLGSGVPVSSTKSLHGHLLGGSGAVEAAITILALQHGLLPVTAGTAQPDPALAIDLVRGETRKTRATHALSNSFGFGGGNVVLVVGRPGADLPGESP